MPRGKKWEPWQEKYLRDKYLIADSREIARTLGRSYASIKAKATRLILRAF